MAINETVEKLITDIRALEARLVLTDEMMEHLRELYSLIWVQACYDPDSDGAEKLAGELLPHIQALVRNFKL